MFNHENGEVFCQRNQPMETLIEKIEVIVSSVFPGCSVELESRDEETIGGFLLWNGFEGIDQYDRQVEVRNLLRKRLSKDEERAVSFIFAFTPYEMANMREE
jgi:hypothetical protein